MAKLSCQEGDVVLLPLREGGWARGVIARTSSSGTTFGYFFGPKLTTVHSADLSGLLPERSILRVIFGDLGILNGEWKIIDRVEHWDRDRWPLPDFIRGTSAGRGVRVRLTDRDPSRIEFEEPTDDDGSLPDYQLSGYGAVELKLTRLSRG